MIQGYFNNRFARIGENRLELIYTEMCIVKYYQYQNFMIGPSAFALKNIIILTSALIGNYTFF